MSNSCNFPLCNQPVNEHLPVTGSATRRYPSSSPGGAGVDLALHSASAPSTTHSRAAVVRPRHPQGAARSSAAGGERRALGPNVPHGTIPPRAPTPSPGHASRPRLRSSVIQQQRRDFDTLVESHRTVRGLVLQPRLRVDIDVCR